jgi:predicted alpha/beta-hydrolase family hydrolase
LHPPNQPDRRRDAHLGRIRVPMLFVQGERDVFGTAEEMSPLVAALPQASLYVVNGGNHSLETGKRGGNERRQAFAAVQDRIADWISGLGRARGRTSLDTVEPRA